TALALGAVANGTMRTEQFLAGLHGFVQIFERLQVRRGLGLFDLSGQPALEVLLAYHFDLNRQERVALGAQSGALSIVGPFLAGWDLGPLGVNIARNGVLLAAKVRDPEGVDDIRGGDQEANLLARGQYQWVVHREVVVVTLLGCRLPGPV